MEIIAVNEYLIENVNTLFPYQSWETHNKPNFSKTIEELYLNQLAADSSTFEVRVTDSWFIKTYCKVVDFLSSTWYHLVLVVKAILTGIGALMCILFIVYLLACTKIHAYKAGENNETHELHDLTNEGENWLPKSGRPDTYNDNK